MATFPAFLDTNVLFGFHLSDVVLALAERGLFRPLWSDRILDELSRNLINYGIDDARVIRRITALHGAFPDASVTGYDELIDTMTCDRKDRHVLAAAVRANAEVLVTFNLKDFPRASLVDYEIEAVHPDKFLLDQLDLYPGPTTGALVRLVADYSRPEITMDDLLIRLGDAGVPEFASAVRAYL